MTEASEEINLGGGANQVAQAGQHHASSPGVLLAAGRQKLGWSVGDVAAKLRMSVQQVDAIEQSEYSRLPTGTFLRGFVRSYAKLVALDPDQVLKALEDTHPDGRRPSIVVPTQNIAVSAPGEHFAAPRIKLLLLAALFVALAGFGAYWWLHIRSDANWLADRGSGKSETVNVPVPSVTPPVVAPVATDAAGQTTTGSSTDTKAEAATAPQAAPQPAPVPAPPPATGTGASGSAPVPPATKTKPGTPAANTAPVAAPSIPLPAAEPQPAALTQTTAPLGPVAGLEKPTVIPKGSGGLKFSFTGECWVEVTEASGKTLISRRFKAGESEAVVGKLPLSIAIGNAPVTKLRYNDVDFDLGPHTRVAVARFTLK